MLYVITKTTEQKQSCFQRKLEAGTPRQPTTNEAFASYVHNDKQMVYLFDMDMEIMKNKKTLTYIF